MRVDFFTMFKHIIYLHSKYGDMEGKRDSEKVDQSQPRCT